MNSEQLESSLRTEFESYLKSFRAEMREHAAELQKRVEAEMDKHRSLLDEAFQAYAARFDSDLQIDAGFKASVVEHLRQARDEGAALTANAMAEAAEYDKATAATPVAAPADYAGIRDAVGEISRHRSQAAILKSLVEQAEKFATRGAFFIIKNEHFEGWKTFGHEGAETAVRDIRFHMSADSILASAVCSLTPAEAAYGVHAHDASFLIPLNYGQPERMHAIPLVARGRGVAVLYVDNGIGGSVNVEALETLVRIAGLTVEFLASAQAPKPEPRETAPVETAGAQPQIAQEAAPEAEPAAVRHETAATEEGKKEFSFAESENFSEVKEVGSPFSEPVEAAPATEQTVPTTESPVVDEKAETFEPVADFQSDSEVGEVIFDAPKPEAERSPFDSAADFEPAGAGVGVGGKKSRKGREKAFEVSSPSVGRSTRVGSRAVDLPIEVSEEERRPHNDARRFARLLVSEIKLYNEQKVTEGRQQGDLYFRLREAIDRSREMYDKRVQPPVAQKFDYFHYELVNSLADGNAERFGTGYPGASV